MTNRIHTGNLLPPNLGDGMRNTALFYLEAFYKRALVSADPSKYPLPPEALRFNLCVKTRALIAHDRILRYGAVGEV